MTTTDFLCSGSISCLLTRRASTNCTPMPTPYSSRSRHNSPPSTIVTSTRNDHKRNSSNPSYSPTITSSGHQQKLNVVTRVAIEGKARRSQDGASIRMFLKVCDYILATIFILIFLLKDNSTPGLCHPRLNYPSLLRFERLLFPYFIFIKMFALQRKMSRSSRPRSTH